jgi:hypothetical protein
VPDNDTICRTFVELLENVVNRPPPPSPVPSPLRSGS